MTSISERDVKLVLALGQHDADYVDAYDGPPEWRAEAETRKMSLAEIGGDADGVLDQIPRRPVAAGDDLVALREEYLRRQLEAVRARLRMLTGTRLSFDEESKTLYDAVAPRLAYAGTEAARRYLNGEIDRAAATTGLTRYAIMSPPRAAQRKVFRSISQLRHQQ